MKTLLPTVIALGVAAVACAQTEPTPVSSPAGDPAARPPVVRLPSVPVTEAGGVRDTADVPSVGGPVPGPGLSEELGWSITGVELRQPPVTTVRTNRAFVPRGTLPKVVRPERRGVGGFFAGVANLFNPFAPVAEGTAAGTEYWHEMHVRPAPLPRAFQSELTHEPRLELMKVDIDGQPVPAGPAPKDR